MADKGPVSGQEVIDMARNTSKGAEGEERPVREKLKNAAISSQRGSPEPSDPDASPDDSAAAAGVNGSTRPARKRSLSDLRDVDPGAGSLDAPATPSSGSHQRKKTREQKDEQKDRKDGSTGTGDDDDAESPREGGSSPPSDEALGSREGSATPPARPGQKVPQGDESPRKKRSAEDMAEGFAHKQKIPATEVAQIARKSLDENRPNLEPNRNGISSAAQDSKAPTKNMSGASTFGASAPSSSPFASFGSKPGETKPSAFSQAAASSSPFGAFGSSAKPSMAPSLGNSSTSSSGDASSKLSFANASSAFTAGSAFGGAGAASGGKLSSFASPKGDFQAAPATTRLSTFASPSGGDFKPTTAKLGTFSAFGGGESGAAAQKGRLPFGAPADERSDATGSDDEKEGGDESTTGGDDTESRADEDADRSQGPKVPPGEEDEETLFSSRAKLYVFTDGAWKERGTGTFKLNIHRDSDLYPQQEDYDDLARSQAGESEDSNSNAQDPEAGTKKEPESKGIETTSNTTQARFIMRATATHRIIINAPLFKWMLMGDPRDTNKPPLSKQMVFGVPEEGKMLQYLLRIGREGELKTLYQTVKVIQKKL